MSKSKNPKKSKKNHELNPFIKRKPKKLGKKLKPQSHTNTEFSHRQILLPDQRIEFKKDLTFKDCLAMLKTPNPKSRINGIFGIKHLLKNYKEKNKFGYHELFECLFPLVLDREKDIRDNLFLVIKEALLNCTSLKQYEEISNKFSFYIITAMSDINNIVGMESLKFLNLCVSSTKAKNNNYLNKIDKVMKNYFCLLKIPLLEIDQNNLLGIRKSFSTTMITIKNQFLIFESVEIYLNKIIRCLSGIKESEISSCYNAHKFMASQIYNNGPTNSNNRNHGLSELSYKMFYLMFHYSEALFNDKRDLLERLDIDFANCVDTEVDLELKVLQLSISIMSKTYCLVKTSCSEHMFDLSKSLLDMITRFPLKCGFQNKALNNTIEKINNSILDILLVVGENGTDSKLTTSLLNAEVFKSFEEYSIKHIIKTMNESENTSLDDIDRIIKNILKTCSNRSIEAILSSMFSGSLEPSIPKNTIFNSICKNLSCSKEEPSTEILDKIVLFLSNENYQVAMDAFKNACLKIYTNSSPQKKQNAFSTYSSMADYISQINDKKIATQAEIKHIRMSYIFVDNLEQVELFLSKKECVLKENLLDEHKRLLEEIDLARSILRSSVN